MGRLKSLFADATMTRSSSSGFGGPRPVSSGAKGRPTAPQKPEQLELGKRHQALLAQYKQAHYKDVVQAGTTLLQSQPSAFGSIPLCLLVARAMVQEGQYDGADQLLKRAIQISPGSAELRELRAQLLGQQLRWQEAREAWYGWFPASGDSGPTLDAFLKSLVQQSVQCFTEHQYLQGALVCARYLALRPDNADVWGNLGIFQTRLSHFKDSEQSLTIALKYNDKSASFWNSIGNLYSKTARHAQAIKAFNKCIEISPNNSNAWANLANEHHINAQLDEAYRCSLKALELSPGSKPGLDHLTRMRRICNFAGIEEHNWFDVGLEMPVSAIPNTSLNFLTISESHEQNLLLKRIFSRWADWVKKQASLAPVAVPITAQLGRDGAPIRIGLLSADLRHHSVAKFLQPVVEYLDPSRFVVEAFSCYPDPKDAVQQKLRQQIPHFHDVERLSHRDLATLIRSQNIDVLIDLTGFTNHNRAGVVCYRPAPVQIGWLGYPGTTALADLDYLLLDRYLSPVDTNYLVEKPLIMEGSSVCFGTQQEIPICEELPFDRNGYITFGSLNNSYKITAAVVDAWAQVMQRVPNSKFRFYRREFESSLLKENLSEAFAQRGVDPTRIIMENNRALRRPHLDCYNDIDLSLDTFPVVGGTTTCDAIWMGVPVVALEGLNIHQRVCSAILSNLGCPELIARTIDEYLTISTDLAQDVERLRGYRRQLRQQMLGSTLCDGKMFAHNFSQALLSLPEFSKSK